jgi:hypothetical protein
MAERQLRVINQKGDLQGYIGLAEEYRILLNMTVASMKADLASLETRLQEIDAELATKGEAHPTPTNKGE